MIASSVIKKNCSVAVLRKHQSENLLKPNYSGSQFTSFFPFFSFLLFLNLHSFFFFFFISDSSEKFFIFFSFIEFVKPFSPIFMPPKTLDFIYSSSFLFLNSLCSFLLSLFILTPFFHPFFFISMFLFFSEPKVCSPKPTTTTAKTTQKFTILLCFLLSPLIF